MSWVPESQQQQATGVQVGAGALWGQVMVV